MKSPASRAAAPDPEQAPPAVGIDPCVWRAQSAFRQAVYRALCRVAPGQVTTYAALARAVGCRSPRAVGQALRRNPFAPTVPCHRVVASDLSVGGFAGRREGPELARKQRLLRREGVEFAPGGRLADPARVAIFP
jgi:methylated-DNA-[protein]-cysteine S-methyltransferase